MLKSKVLFVGIGQCGGNVALEFKKKGYTALFVNTSIDDLMTLPVERESIYHIPMTRGCGKNREQAKEYIRGGYERIQNLLLTEYPQFRYVYFCHSVAGGTGGGMTPVLINILARNMPGISFGAISILPYDKESLKVKHNAIMCIKELTKVKLLKNVLLVQNEGKSKEDVNRDIAVIVDRFLTMSSPDTRGIIDLAEVEMLMNTSGFVQVINVDNGMGTEESLLATSPMGCTYAAYILKEDTDFIQEEIEGRYGRPLDYFKGYTAAESFVMLFGLKVPRNATERLISQYEDGVRGISGEKNGDFAPHLSHVELPTHFKAVSRLTTEVQVKESQGINSLFDELN